jgi:hypothetical protein
VIVVVRHSDNWYGAGATKELAKSDGSTNSMFELTSVERRAGILKHQVHTRGKFLKHGANSRGYQQRVIVGAEPSDDPLGADAQTPHDISESFERRAWIIACVLSAQESLFFVVADDPQPFLGPYLDESDSAVVKSADANAGEIGRLPARKSGNQLLPPLGCEMAR